MLKKIIAEIKYRYTSYIRGKRKPKDLSPWFCNDVTPIEEKMNFIKIPNWNDQDDVKRYHNEIDKLCKKCDYLKDVASGKRGWIFGHLKK